VSPEVYLQDPLAPPAEDERLVGVVMGTFDGRRGWIFRLAVDPAAQGRGVGRRLVEELERRFLAMDVRRIRLLTLSDNRGGRAFWRSVGYEEFPGIVMFSKDLDGADPDAC
jgi:ribosomal protein S18 acetylase RimI-like enzyme